MIKKIICLILVQLIISPVSHASQEATTLPAVRLKADRIAASGPIEDNQIKRKEIKASPVLTFTELLAQQQSTVRLTNQSGDNSQTALSIRGFGDNAAANSLILIDGFPLTNASLLAPNLNSIALADIERIDIIQGSRGVLWGDQAVGGVVNIMTRHPGRRFAEAGLGIGNFQYRTGYFIAGEQFKNGTGLKISGFRTGTNQYREHNRLNAGMLLLAGSYDYANGSLQLKMISTEQNTQFPGGLSYAQYHRNPRQATNFTNKSHMRTPMWQLWHQHTFLDNWLLDTRLSYQDLWGDGFIFSHFDRHEWEARFAPRLTGKIKQHALTLGGELVRNQYAMINRFVDEGATQNQKHIFIHDNITLSDTLSMTIGLRSAWENTVAEQIKGVPNASAQRVVVSEEGLVYRPQPGMQFYLRRDGNFRFPKANESTWTRAGTIALLPQTGISYEAGFLLENMRHKFGVNIYDLRLRDEIGFDPTETPTNPFGSFQNFDPTERQGFSVTEKFQLFEATTLEAELNYVNARFISGPYQNKRIPAVPNVTGNIGIAHTFLTHWRTRYSILYTGPRFASEDLDNQGGRLPGYSLQYLSLQYFNKFSEISFEVGNIFNQRYANYVLYDQATKTRTYYPGLGRTYLLTLKIFMD